MGGFAVRGFVHEGLCPQDERFCLWRVLLEGFCP